jgi:hypothetical protein
MTGSRTAGTSAQNQPAPFTPSGRLEVPVRAQQGVDAFTVAGLSDWSLIQRITAALHHARPIVRAP